MENRTTIEQKAHAALNREYFHLRELAQSFLHENPKLSEVNRPQSNDARVLAAAASLIELFAVRRHQEAPSWTKEIGSLPERMYLIDPKEVGQYILSLCETESPVLCESVGFLAPPNFLDSY